MHTVDYRIELCRPSPPIINGRLQSVPAAELKTKNLTPINAGTLRSSDIIQLIRSSQSLLLCCLIPAIICDLIQADTEIGQV